MNLFCVLFFVSLKSIETVNGIDIVQEIKKIYSFIDLKFNYQTVHTYKMAYLIFFKKMHLIFCFETM